MQIIWRKRVLLDQKALAHDQRCVFGARAAELPDGVFLFECCKNSLLDEPDIFPISGLTTVHWLNLRHKFLEQGLIWQ